MTSIRNRKPQHSHILADTNYSTTRGEPMNWKIMTLFLGICLIVSSLAGCQTAATQSASLPPTATTLPPTSPPVPTDTPAPTPTPVPTDTPVLPTATITASPEQPVNSIDEVFGVWKGYWSDQNMILMDIGATGLLDLTFEKGRSILAAWITIENGIMTWGDFTKGEVATKCQENPVATYEVYITRRGDQPESLRFVLVGAENCFDRQEFLDGKTLRWVEPGG